MLLVFDMHSQKSSTIATGVPNHFCQRGKITDCYVHALLVTQQRSERWPQGGLSSAAESLASTGPGTTDTNAIAEPKSANNEETVCDEHDEHTPLPERLDSSKCCVETPVDKQLEGYLAKEILAHSRLLTKRQLSEMVLGVRALSERLARIRLTLKAESVLLLTKVHDDAIIRNTREVSRWLLSPERDPRYTVYVEENLRDNKNFNAQGLLDDLEKSYQSDAEVDEGRKKVRRRLKYWTDEMCRTRPHIFDFIVTLGGDGAILYASWLFQRIVPPVFSFSLEGFGFLTKFDYGDFREILTRSLKDGVTVGLRLRFEGTVMRSQKPKRKRTAIGLETGHEDDEQDTNALRDLVEELIGEENAYERTRWPDGTYEILNDIVVDRGPNPSGYSFFQ